MNDDCSGSRVPQFSIATLLLSLAFIAVFASHIRTSFELSRTREALKVAQRELGVLSIDDLGNLAVIALPSESRTQWRWRIKLPEHQSYRLRYVAGSIPKTGLPKDISHARESTSIFSNGRLQLSEPFILSAGLGKTEHGDWRLKIATDWSSINPKLVEPLDWLNLNPRPSITYVAGRTETQECAASDPLVLLRYYASDEDPTSGILVWIEPDEEN